MGKTVAVAIILLSIIFFGFVLISNKNKESKKPLLEKNPLYYKYKSKAPYVTSFIMVLPLLVLGFLPLISPFILLYVASDLMINLLSSNPQLHQIYYQYRSAITPFLFIASVYSVYFLRRLYVDADYIGRGIGAELLEEIERRAKIIDRERIFLHSTIGAHGFYLRQRYVGDSLVRIAIQDDPNVEVDVYFMEIGKDDCDVTPAAVEVMILSSPGGNTRVRREGFDISSRGNNFDQVTKGNYSFEGVSFCAKATVNLTGNDQQVRIRPLYNRAVVGVDPQPANATLPNQYLQVESVGQTEAGVTRAVTVKRSEPQLPPIFDYALFSGGGIIKGQ